MQVYLTAFAKFNDVHVLLNACRRSTVRVLRHTCRHKLDSEWTLISFTSERYQQRSCRLFAIHFKDKRNSKQQADSKILWRMRQSSAAWKKKLSLISVLSILSSNIQQPLLFMPCIHCFLTVSQMGWFLKNFCWLLTYNLVNQSVHTYSLALKSLRDLGLVLAFGSRQHCQLDVGIVRRCLIRLQRLSESKQWQLCCINRLNDHSW